jgi:glycosyltransferase involved in cell wall biosynthesis
MNVLHLITSLKVGGAERALCNLLKVISVRGMNHHVAYFHDGPCRQTIENLGIQCYQIKGLISCYDPISIIRLYRHIHSLKPDVLHTSLWSANVIGRLVGSFMNIPVISDLHGNCDDEGLFRNLLDRATAHLTYRTVAVAHSVKTHYQARIVNNIRHKNRQEQVKNRLIVIQNGIESVPDDPSIRLLTQSLRTIGLIGSVCGECPSKLKAKTDVSNHERHLPSDAFVIGSVGRLEPIKSYDILIQAFDRAFKHNTTPQAYLVLVGDGSQMNLLKRMVKDLNLENKVIFMGFKANPAPYYQMFNCFALSSQSEGMSIALLEAMAYGLPIITTHPNKNHDVIIDQVNGFLIPPNDIQSYSQGLITLNQNRTAAEAMGQRNKLLVQEKFNLSNTATAYEKLFIDAAKISQTENRI